MPLEIERKFLLKYFPASSVLSSSLIIQGYMVRQRDKVVRIRINGKNGFITIKGPTTGFSRKEYEYSVPLTEAREMLDIFCGNTIIEKKRYKIRHKGMLWEIDKFSGANDGLVVAEIELDSDDQEFEKPEWVGKEVSGDPRYYNSNLIKIPYSAW